MSATSRHCRNRQRPGQNPKILLGAVTDTNSAWVAGSELVVNSFNTETVWTLGRERHVEYGTDHHVYRVPKAVLAEQASILLENGNPWPLTQQYWHPSRGDLVFYVQHRTIFGPRVDLYDIKRRGWLNLDHYPPSKLDFGLIILMVLGVVVVLRLLDFDFEDAISGAAAAGVALYVLQHIVGLGYSVSLWWRRSRASGQIKRWLRRKDKTMPEGFLKQVADVCSLSAHSARKRLSEPGCLNAGR